MKIHLLKLFLGEFRKRKKKTALITFAIAWGALSLLLMMAFGRGLSNQFRIGFQQFDGFVIVVDAQVTEHILDVGLFAVQRLGSGFDAFDEFVQRRARM